jgi:sortase A
MKATRPRLLLFTERASWAFGLVGLVWWSTFQISVATSTKQDLERFAAARLVAQNVGTSDLSLWSHERIAAWRKALLEPATASLAVLRIPKIQLEVPVLDGTDDRTLDRAVGYIGGTAQPGTVGNVGIAGHRDGFFRGLKDIAAGDVIEVDTRERTDVYRVERTWVVKPEDVSVLDQTPTPTLTLVTCYPFYFIGSAPRRFIVRAVLVGDRPVSAPAARGVPDPQVQTIALSHFLVVPHRN